MQFLEHIGLKGDTQWFSVDRIPEEACKIKMRFIAASERSVHALCGKYDMYEGLDRVIYVDVHEECVLNHTYRQNIGIKGYNRTVTLPEKDHRHSVIAPGFYAVGINKSFFPLRRRKVKKQSEAEMNELEIILRTSDSTRPIMGQTMVYIPSINPATFLYLNWLHDSCRLRDYSGYTGYNLFENTPPRLEWLEKQGIKYEVAVLDGKIALNNTYWHQKTKELNEQYGIKPSQRHVHLDLPHEMNDRLATLADSNGVSINDYIAGVLQNHLKLT